MQISIDERTLPDKDVDVYAYYSKLNNLIGDTKGIHAYCRAQYWGKTSTCKDKSTYGDFVALLNHFNYTIADAGANTDGKGCGFCDQLYASLDAEYVIKDSSGNAISIAQKNKNATQTINDDCELNRVICKLDKLSLPEFT